MKTYEPGPDARGLRIGIVAARFHEAVVRQLADGAIDCARRHGAGEEAVEIAWVAGAWELPLVVRAMAETGRFDAIVAAGAVVRGETAHFDYVAGQAARVGAVSLETGVPVGNAVLTTDTLEQAFERAGGAHGNAGWQAAEAAIESARLLAAIE